MENNLTKLESKFRKILRSKESYPVDFDLAWEWIGYSSKQKGKDSLLRNFIENDHYTRSVEMVKRKQGGGAVKEKILLTKDTFKMFCMLAQTSKGNEVREYFIKVEKKLYQLTSDTNYIETRDKSKKVRNMFTGVLQNHGIEKPTEFRDITFGMKNTLNIKAKKNDMDETELQKILLAETLSSLRLNQLNADGFYEVNPICLESSTDIKKLIDKPILISA
jgi:phage anti-repressor protein